MEIANFVFCTPEIKGLNRIEAALWRYCLAVPSAGIGPGDEGLVPGFGSEAARRIGDALGSEAEQETGQGQSAGPGFLRHDLCEPV